MIETLDLNQDVLPEETSLQVHEAWKPVHAWYGPCRQAFELVLAALLLILSAPAIGLAILLIKLTSPGPAFYLQTRLGRYGKLFTIYKLRTMVHDCERFSGPCWAKKNDPRVTAIGRLLRKLHIDELPQLWNVLIGDMGLLGPRPERPEFLAALEEALPDYRLRLLARPGISGLAQVQLPPDTDLDSVRRKLPYDLFYVRHASPWLDLRIYLATAMHLISAPVPLRRTLLMLPHGEHLTQPQDVVASEQLEFPVRLAMAGSVGGDMCVVHVATESSSLM